MAEKQIFSRILHKYDTEANWDKAKSFIPKKGELIIYSDRSSFKVGDGETTLPNLKFFDKRIEDLIQQISEEVPKDWNASEGELGYIENRTHYIGSQLVYVLAPTNVTYDFTYNSYSVYKSVYLVVGEEYIVTWRGQQYKVVGQDVSAWAGSTAVGLGHCASIGGVYVDVPFGLVSYNGMIDCWPQDGMSDSFDLAIQAKTLIYHKLSKDFLPDDIVYTETLNGVVDSKIDKEAGKGLSTNDYTDADKTKLSGIASGAQVNVIESVKVNGSALNVSSKAVNIDLSAYATKAYADQAETDAKTYANSLAKNYATAAQGAKADSAVQPGDLPTALKNPQALSVGSKVYDGSTAITINASDFGLSNALHFIGTVSSLPSSANNGDVVLMGSKEYVYSNGWVELGDGDSHALKTITISAGSGLTGGGDLSSNRTISHADTSSVTNLIANGRKYVTGLTFDEFGHVTGITTGTETVVDTTYSAGTGLSLSGTTFNHSNSITAKTAFSQNATLAPGYAGTFKVYEPKYDAQGHITGVREATITMPSAQTIPTYTLGSFGITATSTELNYVDGVTSNIQTQLNARLTKILVEGEDYGPSLPSSGTKGRIFFKTTS